MRLLKITLLFLLSLSSSLLVSQERKSLTKNQKFQLTEDNQRFLSEYGVVRCATVENEVALHKNNKNRASAKQFEEWLAPLVAKVKEELQSSRRIDEVINIPVVIHIIHDGDPVNTTSPSKTENISDAQAISQVDVLNEDFRRLAGTPGGINSTGVAVDTKINFVLAKTAPDGSSTTGIVRHTITPPNNTTRGVRDDWETRADVESMKTTTQWDPTKYMNMWCLKFGGLSSAQGGMDGILGYAQFPTGSGLSGLDDSGAADTDGVTSGYQYFGTSDDDDGTFELSAPYDKGRTMTHEVGHYLGLRHIWGDTSSCTNDDFCADTPDATTSNGGCNKSTDSCPDDGLGRDMVENYMDYTNDTCMDTFTADQTLRMITVMQNSPRRASLASSTAGEDPGPIIAFSSTYTSITEDTKCNYTDYEYILTIDAAPSEDANITVTATGTADANDYEIIGGDIVFLKGETTSKTVTVRLFNDAFIESEENITLNLSLNANGGDARIIDNASKELIIIINDNDFSIEAFQQNAEIFSDDFSDGDASDWTVMDNNSETLDDWSIAQESNWDPAFGIYTNYFMVSYSWNDVAFSPDNFLSTPLISIPSNATNIELSYLAGSGSDNDFYSENYEVWISSSITNVSAILAGTRVVDENLNEFLTAAGGATRTLDLSAYAGQNIYISFRHHDTTDEWLLGIDDVKITADISAGVQTAVNTSSAFEAVINTAGKVYAVNPTNNNVIVDIENNTSFNFGCVSASVMRSGSNTQAYINTSIANSVSDKVFRLTSENDTETGSVTLDFYLTKTELEGWEAGSGLTRDFLNIHRYNNGNTVDTQSAVITAFGDDAFKVSASFNGVEGDYYFGDAKTLTVAENEIENFTLYPNPSEGAFYLKFPTTEDVYVTMYDLSGRKVFTEEFNQISGIFNQEIKTNKLSSGVYLLKVNTGKKQTTKRVFVK